MAEIKSTFELAMERTKKMAISEEEREEFRRKESLKETMALFHRYAEGSFSLNELRREIERREGEKNVLVETLLLKFQEALSLGADNEKLLEGIEYLSSREIGPLRERLLSISSEFRGKAAEARQEAERCALETLRKEGIQGSAVEVSVESSDDWKRESARLRQEYGRRWEEAKAEWRPYK